MPVTIAAVGTVETIASVEIRSQVTGQLSAVNFAEGQEVRAGQLLFTIDPRPFQVALDQASAGLARDEAQLANARKQAERYTTLLEGGLIPREEADTQTTNAAALEGTVAADRAAVEAARLNLEHSRIFAPVAGRTGALMVHPGDLVQANGTTSMVVINQLTPIYVGFAAPGRLLDDIRRYQASAPLNVALRAPGASEDQAAIRGRVTFIDNAVDSATGTIKLKATSANVDRALWPGQFVDVTLTLTTDRQAVVIPSVAVQAGQQGQYVYVVDGKSTAQLRQVAVARVEGSESVIASGLNGDETVVTDGQLRLTPGAQVVHRAPASQQAAGRVGEGS